MTVGRKTDFSLYIHFPWCQKKCPYCDFNSHVAKQAINYREYVTALLDDLKKVNYTGRKLISIFMGGGTPSLFPPSEIAWLLDNIAKIIDIDSIEITLEANPGTLDNNYLCGYRAAGINRISLGVQSFNDTLLQKIGRIHSSKEALTAIDKALELFHRVNIDLMFALPDQEIAMAMTDLETACKTGVEHISWYQLTIEENTHFAKCPPSLPKSETIDSIYEQGLLLLQTHDFRQYEISAHTRNKPSTHNLNYWQGGDYIGIGAGAHSKWTTGDNIVRWSLWRSPKKYLNSLGNRQEWFAEIKKEDRLFEYLLNRSRMQGSVSWQEISEINSIDITYTKEWFNNKKNIIEDYLITDKNGIKFTDKAMLFNRRFLEILV